MNYLLQHSSYREVFLLVEFDFALYSVGSETMSLFFFRNATGLHSLLEPNNQYLEILLQARTKYNTSEKYLEEKSVEFKVNPIALGFFGGCYNFNSMSWFFKKLSSIKPKLESADCKESKKGFII